jgi:hypothetical protein
MMDIREMKAGRELDYLVARNVMGWDFGLSREGWRAPKEYLGGTKIYEQFQPSTKIADAWEVVEKMNSPYVIASTEDGDESWVHFGDEANVAIGTAPEAICKAALLQMEVS